MLSTILDKYLFPIWLTTLKPLRKSPEKWRQVPIDFSIKILILGGWNCKVLWISCGNIYRNRRSILVITLTLVLQNDRLRRHSTIVLLSLSGCQTPLEPLMLHGLDRSGVNDNIPLSTSLFALIMILLGCLFELSVHCSPHIIFFFVRRAFLSTTFTGAIIFAKIKGILSIEW